MDTIIEVSGENSTHAIPKDDTSERSSIIFVLCRFQMYSFGLGPVLDYDVGLHVILFQLLKEHHLEIWRCMISMLMFCEWMARGSLDAQLVRV